MDDRMCRERPVLASVQSACCALNARRAAEPPSPSSRVAARCGAQAHRALPEGRL